jgi:nitrogen fixation protein FixH
LYSKENETLFKITKNMGMFKMKTLLFALILSVSSIFITNTGFSAERFNEFTEIGQESAATNYIYVKVYEDGAIWVYVYTEDGIFVSKYVEQSN